MTDEPIDWSTTTTSCLDGGCILRDPNDRGMHTNGGCQHLKLDRQEQSKLLRALGREIVRLRREAAERAAEDELAKIVAELDIE